MAALFPDLIKRLDVRSDEFELRERDPSSVCFHRLELALFALGTTENLSEITERLAVETVILRDHIAALTIQSAKAVGNASVGADQITGCVSLP